MRAALIKQTRGRARIATEVAMLDECTIDRPAEATLNETTGVLEPDAAIQVYAGKCRMIVGARPGGLTDRSDTTLTVDEYELVVPIGSGPYERGDVVTFTRLSDSCVTPAGVWRVTSVPHSKWQVHRRLPVEQVADRG